MDAQLAVRHNKAAQRFEAEVPGGIAHADYQLVGNVMQMVHTEVPAAQESRGIAGKVVQAALDYARANGLKVLPVCSYVVAYFQRHPESRDLLASSAGA
jgi:predicted GNAT family acetyltransferase